MDPELPNNNNSQSNNDNGGGDIDQSNAQDSTKIKHPFKIVLVIVAIIIIGIPIFLISSFYIGGYFRSKEIKKQTQDAPVKVSDARKSAEKKYDEEIKQMDDIIKKSGVATAQIASSKIDVCYVEPQYSGIFIDFYIQRCYLRYVQGYSTNLQKSDVKKRILQQKNAEDVFYKEDKTPSNILPKSCVLYEKEGGGDGFIFYIPEKPAGYSEDCNIPSPINNIAISNYDIKNSTSIKVFRTYSPDLISTGTNQIWFYFDSNYYREEVGCVAGSFSCENPRPKAIQAP